MDYVHVPLLPVDYLTAKKLFLLSLYLGATFYALAMERFFPNKVLTYTTFFTVTGFLVIMFISRSMFTFKSLYDYWYVVFFINVAVAFVVTILHLKKSDYAYIFLMGFVAISLFGGYSVYTELTASPFPFNSPMVYMIVFALLPILIGVEHLLFYEHVLIKEKFLRKSEYLRANTDGLTGAWNQRYLSAQLQEIEGDAIITMLDLDDFKGINDRYGHQAGDAALVFISDLIKSRMGGNDVFCRYGGDEFVILSKTSSWKLHQQRMIDLCRMISEGKVIYGAKGFYVTTSIGIYVWRSGESADLALKGADEALYKSKELGKNRTYLLESEPY